MKTLKDLPKHMRTREWILSAIRHEEHKGVHTYHKCDCGKNSCRAMMCAECWKKLLKRKRSKIVYSQCQFDTSLGCTALVCYDSSQKCNSKDKKGNPLYI